MTADPRLTRAEVERIREEEAGLATCRCSSCSRVRDLADTALHFMDRDDERKAVIDDALTSTLERTQAALRTAELGAVYLAEQLHRAEARIVELEGLLLDARLEPQEGEGANDTLSTNVHSPTAPPASPFGFTPSEDTSPRPRYEGTPTSPCPRCGGCGCALDHSRDPRGEDVTHSGSCPACRPTSPPAEPTR